MAESTIITGQFVRISQTPSSIGERLVALIIDYIIIGVYLLGVSKLYLKVHPTDEISYIVLTVTIYLPVLCYAFL